MKVKLTAILLVLLLLLTGLGISNEIYRVYSGCDETAFGIVGFLNFFGISEQTYEQILYTFGRFGRQENQFNIFRAFRNGSITSQTINQALKSSSLHFLLQSMVLMLFFVFYQTSRTNGEDDGLNIV